MNEEERQGRDSARLEGLLIEDEPLEDAEYTDCVFSRCTFSNVKMRNVLFSGCTFENCALRNVTFRECRMFNSGFHESALLGLDWSAVRRCGPRLPILAKMTSCTVKYNTFVDMVMTKMDFTGSVMHDCFFMDCGLGRTVFRRCDLENTTFQHCDLSRADFRDAFNYRINAAANKIAKGRYSQPEVIGLLHGFDIVIEE